MVGLIPGIMVKKCNNIPNDEVVTEIAAHFSPSPAALFTDTANLYVVPFVKESILAMLDAAFFTIEPSWYTL